MEVVKKIFFNGLNELRAFAALSVIFYHIELFKSRDHIGSLFDINFLSYFISRLGKNGVYLFFVLSGFLITYLLLKEKEKYQTILFKKFYLRRIFRIWPLYYLIVCISFVIIPFLANSSDIFRNTPYYFNAISNPENYTISSFLTYLFFLPNIALDYFGFRVVGCTQSWSVGVEEQFYILWPLLIFVFNRKTIVKVFILLIIVFVLSHVFFQPELVARLNKIIGFNLKILAAIHKMVKIISFEFMAIGAVGGYLYNYFTKEITVVTKSKYTYYGIIVSLFFLLFFSIVPTYLQSILLSIFFLLLILTTINDDNKIVFRNKYLSHIGTISYGVYMYHPFILFLVFPFINEYFPAENSFLLYNLLVYLFVFGLTILLSHLSYKYFELTFIKIKDTKYKTL